MAGLSSRAGATLGAESFLKSTLFPLSSTFPVQIDARRRIILIVNPRPVFVYALKRLTGR